MQVSVKFTLRRGPIKQLATISAIVYAMQVSKMFTLRRGAITASNNLCHSVRNAGEREVYVASGAA